MKNLKMNCHNEASKLKASCGYLMRLLRVARNDSSRGAMFGLDARIALAIFGALSVISGAALYSAIKQAKTEQLRQYFEEHIKASAAYYLDTGQQLPQYMVDSNAYIYSLDLAINRENLAKWKGPYFEGNAFAIIHMQDSFTAKLHSIAHYLIFLRQISIWSEMNDTTSDEICIKDSSDCAEWHIICSGGDVATLQQMFDDLDDLVDGGDGALAGKVRYNTWDNDYIMYQGRARKRVF